MQGKAGLLGIASRGSFSGAGHAHVTRVGVVPLPSMSHNTS